MANLLEETRNLMPGRARSHWNLTEQRYEDALMPAHKQAAAEIHKVMGGKYGPIGSGWSTSASFDYGEKMMHMEVGGNYLPKPGTYYVYFRVVGPSFDQSSELTGLLKSAAQVTQRSLYSDLGKYGKPHAIKIQNGIMVAGVDVPEEKMPEFLSAMPGIARSWASALKRQVFKGATEDTEIEEMAAADASLDWVGAAKKLLPKRTGKGQDDLYYRAYLRAIIDGNQAQAGHLAQQYKPARDARRALIDAVGLGESMDEAEGPKKGQPLDAALASIKPGTKLSVTRMVIYANSYKHSTEREYVKVVAKVYPFTDHWGSEKIQVVFKGKGMYRPFRIDGSYATGYVLSSGQKPPMKYSLDAIDGKDPQKLAAAGRKQENIAGAPGAFAISDAKPRYVDDQMADLLDRVRNPRWEYPSWALPKVKLDEGFVGMTIEIMGNPYEAVKQDQVRRGEAPRIMPDAVMKVTLRNEEGRLLPAYYSGGRELAVQAPNGKWMIVKYR